MDKNLFIEKIKKIGTLEDIVEIRNVLTELTDDVDNAFNEFTSINTQLETLTNERTKLSEDNEKLRQANMPIILKSRWYQNRKRRCKRFRR